MKKRNYNKDVSLTLKFRNSKERTDFINEFLQEEDKYMGLRFRALYDSRPTWRERKPYMIIEKIEERK